MDRVDQQVHNGLIVFQMLKSSAQGSRLLVQTLYVCAVPNASLMLCADDSLISSVVQLRNGASPDHQALGRSFVTCQQTAEWSGRRSHSQTHQRDSCSALDQVATPKHKDKCFKSIFNVRTLGASSFQITLF